MRPFLRALTRMASSTSSSASASASAAPAGPRLARRLDAFDAETVWQEFSPLAAQVGAINLGQGFPDWASPDIVKNAMKRAVDENQNQYCRSAGHVPLVKALAKRCGCCSASLQCVLPGGGQEAEQGRH